MEYMADTQISRVFGASFEASTEILDSRKERKAQREQTPINLLMVDNDPEVRAVCSTLSVAGRANYGCAWLAAEEDFFALEHFHG
jgi:hypothetical protein